MTERKLAVDYANNLVFELEKAFWDERGRGARFRMTTVGRRYFQQKCLPLLNSPAIDDIIKVIKDALEGDQVAERVSWEAAERLLTLRVEGCVHRPVEEKLLGCGIEPFTCLPANLVVLAIEEKLDLPVELAEVKLVDGACQMKLIVFEKRPSLAAPEGGA